MYLLLFRLLLKNRTHLYCTQLYQSKHEAQLIYLFENKMENQSVLLPQNEKFKAEYLNADNFYITFKTFKENLKDEGPIMVAKSIRDEIMNREKVSVSMNFISCI